MSCLWPLVFSHRTEVADRGGTAGQGGLSGLPCGGRRCPASCVGSGGLRKGRGLLSISAAPVADVTFGGILSRQTWSSLQAAAV